MARPLLLHIEELVLLGFDSRERHRVQQAVQAALAERLANGALSVPERTGALAIRTISSEPLHLPVRPSVQALAGGIAGSTLDGIARAVAAPRGRGR